MKALELWRRLHVGGQGDKNAADGAAVEAMQLFYDFAGEVVQVRHQRLGARIIFGKTGHGQGAGIRYCG